MNRAIPDVENQESFHRQLFKQLTDWERTRAEILDLSGDDSLAGLLGLDQLGHFGTNGIDLALELLDATTLPANPIILDVGSGYGGVSRYVTQQLADVRPECCCIGIELVLSHCQLSRQIDATIAPHTPLPVICASAERIPLADRSCDAAICVGSMPHFRGPDSVLSEVQRVLRPGAAFVATEEVSLVRDNNAEFTSFRRSHPKGVFHLTSIEERAEQLLKAGFCQPAINDITPWATDIITQRLKALKLFRGSVERILGSAPTRRIEATLLDAVSAYDEGTVTAALVKATAS